MHKFLLYLVVHSMYIIFTWLLLDLCSVAVILTALLCDSVLCLDKGTEAAAPGKTSLKKTSGNGQKSQAADVQKPIKRKPKGKVQYNISGGSDLSESRPKNAGSSPRGSPDKEKDINDKLPPHKVHGDMYSLPPTSSRSDRDRHKAPIKYDSMRFVDSSNPGSSPARVDNPPVKYDSIRAPIDRNSLGGSRKDYSRSGSGSWRRPFKWILSGSQIKRSGSTASSVDWGSPSQSGGIRVPIPKPYADPDGKMLKHLNSRHWKSLEQLQISFGDVVVCHLVKKKTFEWRKFHWLLATNE
ncbi:uncharacterized protein [Bemisia tabaci]|uniref:uncharacterized protein n=1 Tax=Bemisia tabaci TaxID=7038 RepID=UPI003B28A416